MAQKTDPSNTNNSSKNAYENLKKRFAELSHLEGASGILSKDAETAMASGSAEDRSLQLQTLATIRHRLLTDPDVLKWLTEAESEASSLSSEDQRNLFLMKREWTEATLLSPALARELARLASEGSEKHTHHKSSGAWPKMRDWYEHAFNTLREVAKAKMNHTPGMFNSPYEALLDTFNPGLKEETVTREFAKLEKALPFLIREAQKKQLQKPSPLPLEGPFPFDQVKELCLQLLKAIGFDFERGRFDLCKHHPSCNGTADDMRITAQYHENDFLQTVYAALHEGGHALYEQNRPKGWRYQPAGNHLGMALHETESRIIEIQACHTPEFFQFLEKEARNIFKRPEDPAFCAQNLELLINRVEPSFIRIEADELTYPAHVILRQKLEKALIEETLHIDDLPKAWNEGMQTFLGITPPNHAQGCMQDVHWPSGAIGYFPAYTAPGGDAGAAQLFAAACRARPELRAELAKGNFKPLREWLCENVYCKGSLLTLEDLFISATGEPPNAHYYLNHLSERYLGKPWNDLIQNI
ncbi:MAG: carboxypeptidase M32 [Proteobacteria bacterium]|nr:carboxypeptidase M32 [Pseudomonadota bacterium]